MAEISVSLQDGENKSFPLGTAVADVLKDLVSGKQRKQTVAVKCDGRLLDLSTPLAMDAVIEPVSVHSEAGLEILRHSTAHIMALAVKELFGDQVKVAIGPAIEDGFYYDFDREKPFSSEEFEQIEAKMAELANARLPFVRQEMPKEEAIRFFEQHGEIYKLELLREMEAETVSLYTHGGFVDLCRGPHVPDSSWIKVFKLLRVAGSYWRGDEKRQMLTRIYGTAFADKKELQQYLARLEEARKRDHRKLGKQLGLFTIQDQIGPGLILWQPRGALLRRLIEDYWKDEHYRNGYQLLYTPHIARQDLWKTSGHLDFYGENMYSAMEIDEVMYQLKPMNCPFHIGVYNADKHSYREFPIRWCELGTVYRYERTGALHGLMRVRGFTQDDAHIFCRPDQLEEEIFNIIDLNLHILKTFGFDQYDVYLSTRPEKYVGSDEHWQLSTQALKQALEKKGLAYQLDPGEGVFYGPKIDIKIKDQLGRSWQCSTIQVDFNLPERFQMNYTGVDGAEHQPIMIHRALMGSLERFIGVLIEHYAGAFPLWLAPEQARIMNITDDQGEYCEQVHARLRAMGVRIDKDVRNEKLNYKIREAQLMKVPYMLIVGEREKQEGTVTVRKRDGENLPAMTPEAFVDLVIEECGRRHV
ncbi:Ser-tRNA(Thr) hydrolase; threonyl-tRNA synthetase [Desulfobulbus propionicus DSM 2032]|uniref:Threonine--tRNA ligase n=1 Tax=Desulfobulbus propionicus (strain ATCC 33891 / DSM 2032 / VKM B-1956 / 1pr3) TaxID=577650 RepID=A0A7U3YLJ0_DESPD|nr:threonine--tRNA ligase [Desulfobulbus propionicus]ADW17584.1 Ser-tRNA(Thr) hydrolase; threonyl-tRNA synthetase [Desulfobulbus propionicus DSM 2032]